MVSDGGLRPPFWILLLQANDVDQGVDTVHEMQFIYIIMHAIIIVLIEFGVFIPEFIPFVCNPACFSYKLIIIVDLKYNFVYLLLT